MGGAVGLAVGAGGGVLPAVGIGVGGAVGPPVGVEPCGLAGPSMFSQNRTTFSLPPAALTRAANALAFVAGIPVGRTLGVPVGLTLSLIHI